MSNGTAAEFDAPQNLLNDESSMFYKLWKEHSDATEIAN